MGQEHSYPRGRHSASRSTISTDPNLPQLTGSDLLDTANVMAERSDSLPLPDASANSSEIDFPVEKADPNNDSAFSSEPIQPNKSDITQPTSDPIPQEQPWPRRELRPSNELKRVIPSTWIDADDTGDFDPQEENRRARPYRKRTKLSHRKRFDWTGENTTGRIDATPQTATKPEPRPPPCLHLRFTSCSGKAAFGALCATLRDEVTPARDHFNEGYELRKRNTVGGVSSLDNARANTTGTSVLVSEQNCDYSNHPVGRGCLKCMASGLECSLLEDEHSWPCNDCKLEDFECQLYQEPEYKRACSHCQYLAKKQRWLVCSFEYSQDPSEHQGHCKQCQKDDHESCVAGPRPGRARTRLRIGEDGLPFENQAKSLPKTPRISTCMRCLDSQRICSLASQPMRDFAAVCTACDMAGEACELLGPEIPRIPPDTLDDVNTVAEKISIPSELLEEVEFTPTPPASQPKTTGSGTIKTVCTRFCHPMRFDYQDQTSDGSDPCHFCSCAHFGIIGLEEREAEIIEWADGSGWEEVDGGHKGDNVKGTQMCTACTMARMQIMICADHAFRRSIAPGTEADLQEAFGRVLTGSPGDKWCSVCCNLAAWECCIAQEDGSGEGCGLALCEHCVFDLELCDGSFDTMLQLLGEDGPSEARPAGLRADYELLKQDGLLMRYLNWSATDG